MAAIAMGVGAGVVPVVAQPAAAADRYVYVSMPPTWLGNCAYGRGGGNIFIISANVAQPGHTVSMDTGDDLFYMKMRLNENNTVSVSGFCTKYRIPQAGYSHTIRPTRHGQTVWIGPADGPRYN